MPSIEIDFIDGPRAGESMTLDKQWSFPKDLKVYDGKESFILYKKVDTYVKKGKRTPTGRYEQA